MADTTPDNLQTQLAKIGAANFLRQMGNDQTNQAHALAMGQAQLRQMMGTDWKDPAPESDPMKIAAGNLSETITNHYHYHGSGKDGDPTAGPSGGPVVGPSPLPNPAAPSAEIGGPSAGSSAPSAIGGLVRKLAPLVLASTLGAGGVVLGQLVQTILTPRASSTSSAPSAPLPTPQTPSPYRPPTPPDDHPNPISIPERPDLLWELDLGKPTGRE